MMFPVLGSYAMRSPANLVTPFSLIAPLAGVVTSFTALKLLAGGSDGSEKPQSKVVKVYDDGCAGLFSVIVTRLSAPRGASLIGFTAKEIVWTVESMLEPPLAKLPESMT